MTQCPTIWRLYRDHVTTLSTEMVLKSPKCRSLFLGQEIECGFGVFTRSSKIAVSVHVQLNMAKMEL